MSLFEQLAAIVRNTFFESIRQPIVLVLLLIATLSVILCNPLSAFTMEDDQRMLVDLGLATIFVSGTLLSALVSTSVLTREIDNKTALTVIAKPVGRPLFVLGKFLGVGGAMLVCTLYLALVFMLVEMHTVQQTVRDPIHVPVILFGLGAAVLGLGAAVWCNYFYNRVFPSTTIVFITPLLALAYVLTLMFGPDFSPQPIGSEFKPQLWLGVISVMLAVLVITAVALALSTRLGQAMTLAGTLAVFVLGMLSNWMFGRQIAGLEQTWLDRAQAAGETEQRTITQTIELVTGEQLESTREVVTAAQPLFTYGSLGEHLEYLLMRIGYSILPNFDSILITDALTQEHVVPGSYVAKSFLYALAYIAAALSLAVVLFQRREVG